MTEPTVPSTTGRDWLNLDAACPPDIRQALTDAEARVAAIELEFTEVCRQAFDANVSYHVHTSQLADLPDDFAFFGTLGDASGWDPLNALLMRLDTVIGCAMLAPPGHGIVPEPDWYHNRVR